MRSSNTLVLASCFLLVACNQSTTNISHENENPLTASRYGDELADTLANLIISRDPVIEQPGMEKEISKEITKAKAISTRARELLIQGMMGGIIAAGQDASGLALYLDDVLYLSSDFSVDPGPNLHIYLSETVDPRNGDFPDETAVDLGEIQTTYGAQSYAVPPQKKSDALRTLVLWDVKLKKLYGFAQISRR